MAGEKISNDVGLSPENDGEGIKKQLNQTTLGSKTVE